MFLCMQGRQAKTKGFELLKIYLLEFLKGFLRPCMHENSMQGLKIKEAQRVQISTG